MRHVHLVLAAILSSAGGLALAQSHDQHQAAPAKADEGKKKAAKPAAKKGSAKGDPASRMSTAPAPKTGSMPTGGPTPTGKLGTEPTSKGKLGTDPQPGDPQSKPPRPQ